MSHLHRVIHDVSRVQEQWVMNTRIHAKSNKKVQVLKFLIFKHRGIHWNVHRQNKRLGKSWHLDHVFPSSAAWGLKTHICSNYPLIANGRETQGAIRENIMDQLSFLLSIHEPHQLQALFHTAWLRTKVNRLLHPICKENALSRMDRIHLFSTILIRSARMTLILSCGYYK